MKLGGLFGQPKTLAKLPSTPKPAEPAAADPQPVTRPDGLAQLAAKRAKPGEFNIVWPKAKPQQLKDYAPILTLADLEAWLDRCIETGICGFDWETSASEETRKAWQEWLAEFKYEQRKSEYLDRARICRTEGRPDREELDPGLTAKQRATAEKRQAKLDEAEAKEWEGRAADLDAEYEHQREIYLKTPLDPWQGEISTASLCPEPHRVRVVPISHKKGKVFEPLLDREAARKLFLDTLDRKIFRNKSVRKIAVNLGFETKYAAKYAKYIQKPVADPLVAWVRCLQLVDPSRIADPKKPASGLGLKPSTQQVFGVQMDEFDAILKRNGVDFFDEIDASQGEGLSYSAEDADYAVQHDAYWMEIARQIPKYEEWLNEIEMPFGRVIGLMEYWGMRWDTELAEVKRAEAIAAQEAAADEIRALCQATFGIDVNPGKGGKTGEVKHVIFELLKLPVAKLGKKSEKTGNQQASMDEEALIDMEFMVTHKLETLKEEKYLAIPLPDDWETIDPDTNPHLSKDERQAVRIAQRPDHPHKDAAIKLLGLLKNIQKYATLLSSHIDGRGKWVNPVSGRIHANFTPWTETSRLNSSKPNGQNVPRLDNDRFGIRNFYTAGPGKILFFIDFSGFELRILAWRASDNTMIEIFNTGGDMHRKTAAEMTGKAEDEISKKERTDAKPANFGIAYGGTEHSLQTTFKTDYDIRKTLDECLDMVNAVKRAYPGVPQYQVDVVTVARDTGYAETIYGYKRLLPTINSTNKYERESAGRQAGNTPIQGSAADVMKACQNDVYDKIGEGTADVYDAREAGLPEPKVILQHGHTDMIAQIHDEIIFEMDDDADLVDAAHNWIKARMEQPPLPGFPVKIEAEGSVGYAWGKKQDAHKWAEEKRGVA